MAMQNAGELASKALDNPRPNASTSSTKPSLPETWISRLFAKLQARYGRLWSSQWPNEEMQRMAMAEWAERLSGLSGEDIRRGLQDYRGEWPPTVEQFRSACIRMSGVDGEHARMYRRFPPALPKPKADQDMVEREIAKMRKGLKSKGRTQS